LDQAFGAEPVNAAYETLYEASFAVDDLALLVSVVRAAV
jgi:hypothetical protein